MVRSNPIKIPNQCAVFNKTVKGGNEENFGQRSKEGGGSVVVRKWNFFGHLFGWQYLVNQEEWMNSSDRKRASPSLEDEREFTDLLFGDLKATVESVCVFV